MCKKTVYLFALVLALGSVSNAEQFTWIGLVPHGNWDDPAQWGLPATTPPPPPPFIKATDTVTINTGPEGPVITKPGATCGVITLGLNNNLGTLFLEGGTLDVGSIVIPADAPAQFGKLFLDGGTCSVTQPNGLKMNPGGLIDITWGVLVLEGDERTKVDDHIWNGKIIAYGGGGYLVVDYNGDPENPNKTTVIAIEGSKPEPECAWPTWLCHTVEWVGGDAKVIAAGWTITDTPMAMEASTWTITNPGGRANPPTLDGSPSTGKFLISDSDQQSESNPVDSGASHDVSTPSFSTLGSVAVWLHVDVSAQLNNNGAAIFDVEVSPDGGDTWANVFSRVAPGRISSNGAATRPPDNTNADGYFGRLDVDISAVAADLENVKVRFRHYEPNWDWWIALDNIVVDSVPAPQGGPITVFAEDFSDGLGQMNAFSGEGNTGTETWHTTDKGGRYVPGVVQEQGVNRLGPHPNEHPEFAIIDSDADPDPNEDEWLMTPSLDLSGLAEAYLHYESETVMSSDVLNQEVLVSLDGGSTFETAPIFAYTGGGLFDGGEEPVYAERIFDVSGIAAGESQVVFAFRYKGNGDDWWWAIDNVKVTATPSRRQFIDAFAFGSRLLDCATYNDPGVNYTIVLHENVEAIQYDAARGYGYDVIYPTNSPFGDRDGYGVFGPFDDSPNNRNEFPDECPEELYDSFIGAKNFTNEVSEATMGDPDTPSPTPEGIIFRVDVPNGLYRFVGAFGEADNTHAHRILAEDGGSGPPENIGNHVVLVNNHDQAQQTIGQAGEDDDPGDGVFARVGFDGLIPPPGDEVFPSPQFVDMDENGMPTDAGPSSPVLEVTQGYIRIHQLQGNSNNGPGGEGDANGGDVVILELWKVPIPLCKADNCCSEYGQRVYLDCMANTNLGSTYCKDLGDYYYYVCENPDALPPPVRPTGPATKE